MTTDTRHRDTDARVDDALAQAARRTHAASLDRLSPRVQAQLAQRRRAALSPHAPAARRRGLVIAVSASLLAVAMSSVVALRIIAPHDASPQVAADATSMPSADGAQAMSAETASTDAASTETVPSGAESSEDFDSAAAATPNVAAQTDPVVPAPTTPPPPQAGSTDNGDATPSFADAASPDAADDDISADFAALDENPEFYQWLGADGAPADTPESL